MIQLIFARHGETESSRKGTYCGWTDVELNKDGRRQSCDIQQKLKGMKIDSVFASPLKRTRQTVEIINQVFQLPINYIESLKERSFGIWDDLSYEDICERFPEELKQWEKDWQNYCIHDGESALQFHRRVAAFVDTLIVEKKEGVYLVVTHLGCIRSMLAHLLGMGIEGGWRFRVDTGSFTKVTVNDEGYAYLTGLNV